MEQLESSQAQEHNLSGLVLTGKKIRIVAQSESVESLITISSRMKGRNLAKFQDDYGDILDLLQIPVQSTALSALAQYWDDALRCFTFPTFQITPTLEEYGGLMRMPVDKSMDVYLYPGHLPSKHVIALILGEDVNKVQLSQRGQTKGLLRKYVEKRLEVLADEGNWASFRRILALAIYGLVLFPSATGIIDQAAISVFWMVQNHRVNPIPAILAETFLTLSFCHQQGGGKLKCCLQLLTMWFINHLYGKKFQIGIGHDTVNHPIKIFNQHEGFISQYSDCSERLTEMSISGWAQLLAELNDDKILWKLAWWENEEIIYCCGPFPNVPLVGPRGCINYNPVIAHCQFGYKQDVPSEEAVRMICFYHGNPDDRDLSQNIRDAWGQIMCKGKFELGKRIVTTTKEYRAWLKERTRGVCLFAPHNPLLGNNTRKLNELLTMQLEDKKAELYRIEEENRKYNEGLTTVQKEYTTCQEKITRMKRQKRHEENIQIDTLRRENLRLKGEVQEAQEKVKESEKRMLNNRVRLMKAIKEKDALEKQVREVPFVSTLQQEVHMLTEQLQSRMDELTSVRSSNAVMAQRLIESLNQQKELAGMWKARCLEESIEKEEWMKRCRSLILLANEAIPEFADAFKRAEGMANPVNTPVEISSFFSLCNDIVTELKRLMRS